MLAVLYLEAPATHVGDDPENSSSAHIVPTRDRLLRAGICLFQQRGVHAVGLNEVLAFARAPKGSLYHHFKDGKSALAIACIEQVTAGVIESLDAVVDNGRDLAEYLRRTAMETARWLESNGWKDGSLLAAVGQEEAGQASDLGESVRIAYQKIEMRMTKILIAEGFGGSKARELAATIIAANEGALVLARSRRDSAPMHLVSEMLINLLKKHS